MPPKLEDQMAALTGLVSDFVTETKEAIISTNKKIDDLSDVVETLADQLQASSEAQTKASTKTDRQLRTTSDAVDKVAAAAGTSAITPTASVSLLRPTKPPELSTTRMGLNHYDWLQQSLAAIRFWNPAAARLLEDRSLSFKDFDDGNRFYLDPRHSTTNDAVFAILTKAVAGKARSHLNDSMAKYFEDDDMHTPDLSDREHDTDDTLDTMDGDSRYTEQRLLMKSSAYLAWMALSQLDEDSAHKWLDAIASRSCTTLADTTQHLDKMAEDYEKYSGSVDPTQLSTEQPMLARYLTMQIPSRLLLDARQLGVPRQEAPPTHMAQDHARMPRDPRGAARARQPTSSA